MNIVGTRVYLEPITLDHTDIIIKWRNKDNVRRNFIFQDTLTREVHENWLKEKVGTKSAIQFIIYEKEKETAVGSVYLRDIDRVNRKAEYGIFIGDENSRGKGLGTEAAKLICAYGFEVLQLHKIFLRVYAQNIPAITSYKKAGFIEEAYLHDEIRVDGEYRDIILMSLIHKE